MSRRPHQSAPDDEATPYFRIFFDGPQDADASSAPRSCSSRTPARKIPKRQKDTKDTKETKETKRDERADRARVSLVVVKTRGLLAAADDVVVVADGHREHLCVEIHKIQDPKI